MKKYFKYLNYLIKHKWFVFLECCKEGIFWQGVIHDLSKFKPDEFFPYANHFYGEKKYQDVKDRNETGYYKPIDTGDDAFDFAWLLHQKRNRHHWQWWILPYDNGTFKILEMPLKYKKEMFCDWKGAAKAQGYKDNTIVWYEKHKDKMQLGPETRAWIEIKI